MLHYENQLYLALANYLKCSYHIRLLCSRWQTASSVTI